eukprot:TRINITY_DN5258_c0_g1_i1.p2 TRINITY_DN5258_c0_g1~~TRINITY_DN5258_c0_g1_i1.p2  ORF type:complete len:114 (-),score=16.58 TRINITY_DN5258_c0_g1_i1:185-526(-)
MVSFPSLLHETLLHRSPSPRLMKERSQQDWSIEEGGEVSTLMPASVAVAVRRRPSRSGRGRGGPGGCANIKEPALVLKASLAMHQTLYARAVARKTDNPLITEALNTVGIILA